MSCVYDAELKDISYPSSYIPAVEDVKAIYGIVNAKRNLKKFKRN